MHRAASRYLILTVMLAATPALAQLVPTGAELSMSGRDGSRQLHPTTALRKDGSIVIWEDSETGIGGRFFDVHGVRRGVSDLAPAVNDPAPPVPFHASLREYREPALAANADGSFLLVWVEVTVDRHVDFFIDQTIDVSSRILGRLYKADGTALGTAPFEIGKGSGPQGLLAAGAPTALAVSNGYWVAWQEISGAGKGIHVRRLDKKGKLGAPAVIAGGGREPELTSGGNGVLLVWESPASGLYQIVGQLYKSTGKVQGGVFTIAATGGIDNNEHPTATGRKGGDFFVAWQTSVPGGGVAPRVYGQLITKTGGFAGGQLTLCPSTGGTSPRVAALAGGRWGVAWIRRIGTNGVSRNGVDARSLTGPGVVGTLVNLTERPTDTDDLALVAGTTGTVLTEWVGRDSSNRESIRGRLAAVPKH